MIFDSNMSAASATNWDAVQESPYALGVEGALMHVYENECNYNAIMKAAGVSELKYYKENGGDLFVQEAGAAGGLIDRFIAFFKKVIEKIKQMFKKLVMKISSYVSSDKTFVNKYKKEVFKNFKEFDFTGWPGLANIDAKWPKVEAVPFDQCDSALTMATFHDAKPMTDDELEDTVNAVRTNVANGESVESDEELRKALHDQLYGDSKDEFKVTASLCASCFEAISDTKKVIKDAEKAQNQATKKINDYIKILEKARDIVTKGMGAEGESEKTTEMKSRRINSISKDIELHKEYSNIITTTFGVVIGFCKDANRQSKAICVKALNSGSRKDESAMLGGDIFAGVEII